MQPQYRQGDVFLLQVEQLPVAATQEERADRIVLAYGEATGHCHSVSTLEAKLYNDQDQDYLVVDTLARLVHEEHQSIALPAGVYKVVRQREYTPDGGLQFVCD
jgi:hypothetical protein